MLSYHDIRIILDPYFDLLSVKKTHVELMSKNTMHCWLIEKEENHYILYHKHKVADPYHRHGTFSTMQDCFLSISGHDMFQQNKRRPLRFYSKDNFFDYILSVYGY